METTPSRRTADRTHGSGKRNADHGASSDHHRLRPDEDDPHNPGERSDKAGRGERGGQRAENIRDNPKAR